MISAHERAVLRHEDVEGEFMSASWSEVELISLLGCGGGPSEDWFEAFSVMVII